jgi:holin-like protein
MGAAMLNGFLLLIGFQLLGEAVARALVVPVPGMVLGLLGLLGLLALRARLFGAESAVPPGLDMVARGLHGHLGLLFVPAGVGVLAQAELIASEGAAILGAVVLSTLATIAVGGRLAAAPGRLKPLLPPANARTP